MFPEGLSALPSYDKFDAAPHVLPKENSMGFNETNPKTNLLTAPALVLAVCFLHE